MRPKLTLTKAPLAELIIACIFAVFVCLHGVPVLRHDWSWIPEVQAFRANLVDSASGWNLYGFGGPHPYPTDYVFDAALYALSYIASPLQLLVLTVAGSAFAVVIGAGNIARAMGNNARFMRYGAGLIALFNPWTYSEVVAGHILMILAFGGAMLIISRHIEDRWDDRTDVWLFLTVFSQIQFLLITAAISVLPLLRKRAFWTIGTVALLFAPIALGILAETKSLVSTPYFPSWQTVQSVDPSDVVRLSGYFSGYSESLGTIMNVALIALLFLVAYSAANGIRNRAWSIALLSVVLMVCVISGTKGPISGVYLAAIEHVPASGVFRELYDLVAFLCVAYIVMIGKLSGRLPNGAVFCVGFVMFVAWCVSPPSHYWLSSDVLPHPVIKAQPNTRYALLPAFQPFSLGGSGSGADPDEWLRPDNVVPLNEYLPSYPVSAALAKMELYGDARDLGALGVSAVACRPWLRSNGDALNARNVPVLHSASCRDSLLAFQPQIAISDPPGVASAFGALGEGNVLVEDVPAAGFSTDFTSFARAVAFVHAQTPSFDADEGWIDARLIERQRPYFANPFGGVYTQGRRMFSVPAGGWVLAAGDFAERRESPEYRPRFHWFRESGGHLTCLRQCAIALVATEAPPRSTAYVHRWQAVGFRQVVPWLVHATIPPGPAAQLRYNARFDSAWFAFGRNRYVHFAIDGTSNGWLLPKRDKYASVFLIERTAAIQALLEAIALAWLLALAACELMLSLLKRGIRQTSQRHGSRLK